VHRIAVAALLLWSVAAECAYAEDVMLQVVMVKAKQHGESDPELRPLRPRLKRLVGYRSFRMVGQQERGCQWRSQQVFLLPGGQVLVLQPERMADQRVIMHARLLQGDRRLVDTVVQLRNQGTMFIGMGNGRGDDRALLLMLRAGVPQ
jgi:hypothetical protein